MTLAVTLAAAPILGVLTCAVLAATADAFVYWVGVLVAPAITWLVATRRGWTARASGGWALLSLIAACAVLIVVAIVLVAIYIDGMEDF